MTTAVIRKKLHSFIDTANDKKVEEIYYSMVEDEVIEKSENNKMLSKAEKIEFMKQAANDPLFLADMKEISEDFSIVDHENL